MATVGKLHPAGKSGIPLTSGISVGSNPPVHTWDTETSYMALRGTPSDPQIQPLYGFEHQLKEVVLFLVL